MTRHQIDPEKLTDLREQARRILRDHVFEGALADIAQGDLDLEALLEELHIYHAELYLQQEALGESHEANERALARFMRLYHELPLPVLLLAREGRVKDANTAAHRLLPLDRQLFSHLAAAGQERVLEHALIEAHRRGTADCKEVKIRALGDSTLIADLRLIRLPAANEVATEIVCTLVDQTEQVVRRDDLVTANRRLRLQEERYHIVADFAPDWAYWMGEDGRFRYVSPACARISGYPAAAFLKDPELLVRIIHPDDREHYLAHLHGGTTTSSQHPLRFRIQARTGEWRWIEHQCTRVVGENGRPLGHRGSNIDVTEKSLLEQALAMAAEVIDSSSTVALHWKPEAGWPIAYASANILRWGYPLERVLSGHVTYLDIVHPEDRNELVADFEHFNNAGDETYTRTYRLIWADGSVHWVDEETHASRDEAGRIVSLRGVVTDVSERERVQAHLANQLKLQALAADLSSRLTEVTADTLDATMIQLLERIGAGLGADHCHLYQGQETRLALTHAWCRDGANPMPRDKTTLELAQFPWCSQLLQSRQPSVIPDVQALPPEAAAERTACARHAIRSLLSVPLTRHDRLSGVLAIMSEQGPHHWSDDEIHMLQLIGEVLSSTLQRIETARELIASENRYRQVTAVMTDVAYSCVDHTNQGFQLDWITASVATLTGYSLEEMMAMRCWGDLVIPEDAKVFQARVVGLPPNTTATCELRLRHRDGSIRWVRVTTECLEDVPGTSLRRLYGGLLDITAEKSRQDEIERLALVVEQSPSIVLITDVDGLVQYVNQRFTEATGYARNEIIGRNASVLSREGSNREQSAEIWDQLRQGIPWTGEFENQKKSGARYWEHAQITPLYDSQGAISGYVKLAEDISDRKDLSQRLAYLSQYDPLTGLANRLLMRERIDEALHDAQGTKRGIILLSIDLDDLRSVNDSLGHRAGDALLKSVALRWQSLLGERDTLARFSGDNFLILAPGRTPPLVPKATRLATEFAEALREPITLGDQSVIVTCSLGIALHPDDAQGIDELIGHADAALHVAKAEGRGQLRFYASVLNKGLHEQFRIEQALRRAIDRDEFLLHYQPRVDIATGRVLGLEALVRWHDPEQGMIAPDRFIPIAESSGLILLIGPIVFRLACAQIAAWERAGIPVVPIAINLSANELYQEGLVQRICAIAAAGGIDPAQLDLEVTESAAMRSIDQAVEVLSQLREKGFKLAIDDFGTGYASLNYLNRLPVQTIKIDRSFLAAIGSGRPEETSARSIVKAIIGLSDSLNLEAIAEGVETDDQRRFLLEHGCREAQGYFFSRPRLGVELEDILRAGVIDFASR
ncbi:diguanylate cyclase [Thiocapsa imhoffii]|uniref:Diguanylate cyclase n=1 Tax=Thiocapsa imhoffii TaxID=382777 RepID=A0A9X0WKW4_9GAMM|nr:EAL domain-containing protein [Thiocapsa imhoffii]MBK1646632.1 diguanylate cyclase [Thiocapsa imhoffii]